MESAYAFLHPRNAFERPDPNLKFQYTPIPFSPWRPCVPFIERRIPPIGPAALLYRYARIIWVIVSLPTWIGFVLLMEVAPPEWASYLGPAVLPRRPSWTLWQRVTYPLLARAVWSVTFGLPPQQSPVTERGVPPLAKLWYGRGTEIQTLNAAFRIKEVEKRWILNEASDPAGKIVPQDYLAAFWIRSANMRTSPKSDSTKAEVVMYLVGGGYITGHPLEASRVFDVARITSIPVLGVNYRKAVSANNTFPAALQDTIAAYAYLLREGYTRIALAGDSAGAGLALALMQYLARMQLAEGETPPSEMRLPVAACLYSPWADLTFSHDYKECVHFDIIHPTMLAQAAAAYTSTMSNHLLSGKQASRQVTGAAHPFFSPALDSAVPDLAKIREASESRGQPAPRFLIFIGGAELFATECRALCQNLRAAGLRVEEYQEDDETHGFLLVPTFMSSRIAPALKRMGQFLTSE